MDVTVETASNTLVFAVNETISKTEIIKNVRLQQDEIPRDFEIVDLAKRLERFEYSLAVK